MVCSRIPDSTWGSGKEVPAYWEAGVERKQGLRLPLGMYTRGQG